VSSIFEFSQDRPLSHLSFKYAKSLLKSLVKRAEERSADAAFANCKRGAFSEELVAVDEALTEGLFFLFLFFIC
jgi:hypothetical protein